MAQPTTKKEFKEWCLRKLGKPVIEINVDQDQVDDRVEEALSYYWDYHFDGAERTYFRHELKGSYLTINDNNVSGFSVGDIVTGQTSGASMKIISIEGNNIYYKDLIDKDKPFQQGENVTTPGHDANNIHATAIYKGLHEAGYITMPENIIGAINVFDLGSNITAGSGMFNVQYQFVLNNLHDIVNYNLTHFYMSMMNLQFMEELLVGMTPMRYNRHVNKLFLDTKHSRLDIGTFVAIEAYQIVDPDVYQDVWKDRWLQNYATAKIKYQWGSNLTKFNGMTLPGNVQFNGEQILNDAREEIQRLEEDMITSYSLPVMDMIG